MEKHKDPNSINSILEALQRNQFRKRFCLSDRDITYVRQKGLDVIAEHGMQFIRQRLADANPKKDGKQTPMTGHPVFIAQHATATCCRGCLAKWHGIKSGRELTAEECQYILRVIMEWIERQTRISKTDSFCPVLFS